MNYERKFEPIPLFPKPNVLRRHRKAIAAVTLAVTSAGAGAVGSYGQFMTGDPLLIPGWITSSVMDYECPKVPSDTLKSVTDTFDGSTPNPELTPDNQLSHARETASNLGLTLVETEPFHKTMNEAATPTEAVRALDSFMKNFSLPLEVAAEHDPHDLWIPYNPLQIEDIDLEKFKASSRKAVDIFSLIPTEILQTVRIHKIKFVNDLAGGRLAGSFEAYTRTMFLDIQHFYKDGGPYHLLHETGHAIATELCGNQQSLRDPEYRDLNPSSFSYLGNEWSQSADESQRFVARNYGRHSVAEDEATLYELILPGYAPYDQFGEVLQSKKKLLLARLETKVPGISQYYKEINMRRPFHK